MDFSQHRLSGFNDFELYRQTIGKEKLDAFIDRVYSWLMGLAPGAMINIANCENITDKNRDLFIKVACMYISENPEINFNQTFTILKKDDNRKVFQKETLAGARKKISV